MLGAIIIRTASNAAYSLSVYVYFMPQFKGKENPNYKVVAMEEFQTSHNRFFHFPGYDFWTRSFY